MTRSIEKSGKTLHLLKAKSKPQKSGRKRKVIPTLGTFSQYKESKSKASLAKPVQPAPTIQPPQAAKPHK